MYDISSIVRRPKTKIVCTLGPSTESQEMIQELIESGMSVARLNLSHGTFEKHSEMISRVKMASDVLGVPVGVMVDVPGSKYRTGPLGTGIVEIRDGALVTLTSRDLIGSDQIIGVSPPGIHRDVRIGHPILLDDGLLELKAVEVEGEDVMCEVVRGGRVTERRGVTTPGRAPSQPFPDDLTVQGLKFAAEQKADFVALSMVTKQNDVLVARQILIDQGLEDAYIISKVERGEALENFDEILAASDAIMVARGDMGVEVPLSQVPVIQKDLISRSNEAGKSVITATQMLESMVRSRVPTRAEVADVANAIFDGTDAIMLSGETSVGDYPIDAVKVMASTALVSEEALPYEAIIREKAYHLESQTDDAISYDACRTSYQLKASMIVAFTESGSTAGRLSKYRPMARILALTPGHKIQKRLTLRWGVTSVVVDKVHSVEDFFERGEEEAVKAGSLESGELVVLVAGLPIGVSGGTNLLRVMAVGQR